MPPVPPFEIRLTDDDRPVRSYDDEPRPAAKKRAARPARSGKSTLIPALTRLLKGLRRPSTPSPKRPSQSPKRGGGGHRIKVSRALGILTTIAIWGAMALGAVIAYYAYDLPNLDSLTSTSRRPSITLMSSDGQTIAAYGDVYGEPLRLDEMPAFLPQAVMATEDRHFYSHFGIDPIGLMRAIVVNLRAGHVVQGGSTVTQQLAKNLFLTPEKSLKRKIQELLMALWLEHRFTKDQIMTLYLNRVYLGSGTWGVDAAAHRYFDTSARKLNLYQAALLAGLLKAPSRYNPQNDRDLSYRRTSQVLANMVAFGAISETDAQAALKAGPGTVKQISHTGRYFADWVRDQVDQYAGSDRDIVVQTTLDMGLEAKVEAALEATLAAAGPKSGVGQGAVVVMSPDGSIRAMAGGRNYASSQFNRATQGLRQPGSSFKAMVYLTAVEAGWSPDDTIQDSPIVEGKYRPENYTEKYEGAITLRHALAKSSNVAAVRLIETIGPKRVVQVAKRLGITSDLRPDASLALGSSEASVVEMTGAYATFANNGYGVWPHGFDIITDPRGDQIYQRQGNGAGRVIDQHALAAMTDMLSAVITQGTGKGAAIDRPAAGKTGTSQDYRDAWFIGFTADYVCGVWLGNDDGTPMHKVTGATLPAKLWREVMLAAHKGLPVRPLPGTEPPEGSGNGPLQDIPAAVDSIWNGLVKMLGG